MRSNHVLNGHGTTLVGKREGRPMLLLPNEFQMHSLDLLPRVPLLHAQVEADERERQFDRFRLFVRMLRGKSVDDILVNERRIIMGERVAAQVVVLLPYGHGMFREF